jgi:2-succinyl-6-hydroxy-2,4-cyclohexadiene-1-carboxylate synthase
MVQTPVTESMQPLHSQLIGASQHPPIVFLHGFMGRGADFAPIAMALGDRYCSLLIDLPGHGNSFNANDQAYTMAATAQLVIACIDRLQLAPAYLYGYSMGGRLALYLAIHYPAYFRHTMLESASPGCRTTEAAIARQQNDAALADRLAQADATDFSDFLQNWYQQPLFQSLQQHPNFAALYNQRLQNNSQSLAKSLRGMGTGVQPRLWDDLATHNQPLHLLTGELDQKFTEIQTAMRAIAPQVTGSVIQQTGHNIHWENPGAVIREIASFFPGSDFYNCGT